MKDIVKIPSNVQKISKKDMAVAAISHILVALCGCFAARAVVMDKLLPFGIALLAGAPVTYTPAAAIGVFLGYVFPATGGNGFKYTACLFAVLAIKLLLSSFKKIVANDAFLTLIAGLSAIMTSAATFRGLGGNSIDIISETLLTAAGADFFSKGFKPAH